MIKNIWEVYDQHECKGGFLTLFFNLQDEDIMISITAPTTEEAWKKLEDYLKVELKENMKFYHKTEPLLIYTLTSHEDEGKVNLHWNIDHEKRYTMTNPEDVGHSTWSKSDAIRLIKSGMWIVVNEKGDGK